MAKSTVARIRKKAKRAKKTVRRGSAKAKRKVSDAASTVKRRAAKAKKTAKRAKKAVKRATKKVKKTARRAKRAVKRVAKKAKRKARKARIAQASANREAIREAIAETNALFADAIQRGDVSAAAQVYTDDATLLPPGHPRVRGRADIEAFWAGATSQLGLTDVSLETVDLDIGVRRAEEIGRYVLAGDGGVIDEGKYVVIWRRQPGPSWKWHVDIWNSDR